MLSIMGIDNLGRWVQNHTPVRAALAAADVRIGDWSFKNISMNGMHAANIYRRGSLTLPRGVDLGRKSKSGSRII
jgi:hypothetical protein